jgi:serine/threonine protein kinase
MKILKIFFYLSEESQSNNSKKYSLVMEYADSGTLRNYLSKCFENLTWNDKLNLALQLTNAISCLHGEEIVHRDLVGYLLLIKIIPKTIKYLTQLFIILFITLLIALQ